MIEKILFMSTVGVFIVLAGYLGNYQSKGEPQVESLSVLPNGLKIDNGTNRGIDYTDSLGNNYNLRYIPIKISNDSTVSIHLQITFLQEYNYNNEKFKLIPLPTQWGLDGVEISESMIEELSNYIDKPLFSQTIAPGEIYVIAIGTLYPRPPQSSGILPNALFKHNTSEIFPACEWLMNQDLASESKNELGLKLNFGDSCMVIPCGQFSYLGS